MLEIHQSATSNFNSIARELISSIKVNTGSITGIKGYVMSSCIQLDEDGQPISIYRNENNNNYGLYGDDYKKYEKLCKSIHKCSDINIYISLKTIKNDVFDWIINEHKNDTSNDMIPYLLNNLSLQIKERIIYIPIHGLSINEIQFGKIKFKKITSELLDKWDIEEKNRIDPKNDKALLDKETEQKKRRKNMQNFVSAVYTITSDKTKAFEEAFDEVEKTISMLRIFSRAAFIPERITCCAILGCENAENYKLLEIENEKIVDFKSAIRDNYDYYWVINDEMLNDMKGEGFMFLNDLLLTERMTSFQEKLIQSLLLFSKNTVMKTISDKIVYILVSMESMLLKNETEPIVQNLAERMAFYITTNIEERKEIIRVIKEIYSLRSKFVHHGNEQDNFELLKKFYWYTRIFFILLINNNNQFQSKEEFLSYLDDIKLS